MRRRAYKRAGQVVIAACVLAASEIPVAAQNYYANLIEAYERSLRPYKYLRGRLDPYVHKKADFFGGIDAAKATTFVWAGATWAPFATLAEDGWRMRFMGGAGRYSYATNIVPGGINYASAFTGEMLGGYRKTFDNLFGQKLYVGAFAGINYEDQILNFSDPFNPTRGAEAGIKGTVELYSRMWQRYIVTAFGSISTVHDKYYAKGSGLYELNESWALGGELVTMGDARYSENRIGLSGSFTWEQRIFSLSAGVLENSGRGSGTYLTFSVYSPL
jgi:hypothetical protein